MHPASLLVLAAVPVITLPPACRSLGELAREAAGQGVAIQVQKGMEGELYAITLQGAAPDDLVKALNATGRLKASSSSEGILIQRDMAAFSRALAQTRTWRLYWRDPIAAGLRPVYLDAQAAIRRRSRFVVQAAMASKSSADLRAFLEAESDRTQSGMLAAHLAASSIGSVNLGDGSLWRRTMGYGRFIHTGDGPFILIDGTDERLQDQRGARAMPLDADGPPWEFFVQSRMDPVFGSIGFAAQIFTEGPDREVRMEFSTAAPGWKSFGDHDYRAAMERRDLMELAKREKATEEEASALSSLLEREPVREGFTKEAPADPQAFTYRMMQLLAARGRSFISYVPAVIDPDTRAVTVSQALEDANGAGAHQASLMAWLDEKGIAGHEASLGPFPRFTLAMAGGVAVARPELEFLDGFCAWPLTLPSAFENLEAERQPLPLAGVVEWAGLNRMTRQDGLYSEPSPRLARVCNPHSLYPFAQAWLADRKSLPLDQEEWSGGLSGPAAAAFFQAMRAEELFLPLRRDACLLPFYHQRIQGVKASVQKKGDEVVFKAWLLHDGPPDPLPVLISEVRLRGSH